MQQIENRLPKLELVADRLVVEVAVTPDQLVVVQVQADRVVVVQVADLVAVQAEPVQVASPVAVEVKLAVEAGREVISLFTTYCI